MAWSMDAAHAGGHSMTRTVCDVCGAYAQSPRGASCRICTAGVMRYFSELQVLRDARSRRPARTPDTESRPGD